MGEEGGVEILAEPELFFIKTKAFVVKLLVVIINCFCKNIDQCDQGPGG